jgi:dCTP deaminase
MYLPDHEIRKLCLDGAIQNYDDSLIGPASIDVRLGKTIMVETSDSPDLKCLSIEHTSRESPYQLAPQEFILAHTVEKFFIPPVLAAWFCLKSSRGREGISHALAGFGDPGFSNSSMTLELHSIRRFHSVPIWSGMPIGQMVFGEMKSAPSKDYSLVGRYNNCGSVQASMG